MAADTKLTLVGNLTADPELRFTHSGTAVVSFRIASTPRRYDRDSGAWVDGDTLFMTCNAWRSLAENVAESLRRGMRVIVAGRLCQRSYETREGEKRTVFELEADEVGASLRSARVSVHRQVTGTSGESLQARPADRDPWHSTQPAAPASGDPWSGGPEERSLSGF